MAEMAELGISVQADGVEDASRKLNELSGAAARAEKAVQDLSAKKVSSSAVLSAAKAQSSQTDATSAVVKAEDGLALPKVAATEALRDKTLATNEAVRANDEARVAELANAAAMQETTQAIVASQKALTDQREAIFGTKEGFETLKKAGSEIVGQFQDIVESADSGTNALKVGIQHGLQLAMAIGTMENPLETAALAFRSLFSALSLGTIGVVTLAAILVQMVDWEKLAASAMDNLGDVMQAIAPYAVAAAAGLALIYAPAVVGGVINLIALLGELVVQLLIVAAGFVAANPAIAFVLGLVAVVAALNVFRDEIKNIFGRDIVGDIKDAVNFIIGTFVGAFNGIKAAWGLLPSAIGDLVYQTVNFTISGVESMVNKVIEKLNSFIGGVYDKLRALGGYVGLEIDKFTGIKPVDFG